MDNTFIPRRLNDGWKIAWFDLDVALPFVAIFFLGLVVGQKLGALVLGALVSRAVMRIKADKHPAFFLHWVYWHLDSLHPATPGVNPLYSYTKFGRAPMLSEQRIGPSAHRPRSSSLG